MTSVMSQMKLAEITRSQEDLCQNHSSEESPEAETGSSGTDHEEQSNGVAASHKTAKPNPPRPPVDILNGDVDFLELQKANNIMRAAYKEVMTMAVKAKTWVLHTPAAGSIEEFIEVFHAPPSHGSRVECSIARAVLPIPPETLVTIMMDGKKWASAFSHIVSRASSEVALRPLTDPKVAEDKLDVTLIPHPYGDRKLSDYTVQVDAEFRLPAAFLPRWRTRFVRFRKMIVDNIWAVIDVSSDYFKDTTSDSTERVEYKRRPSGVIIREHDFDSEVIWIENVEVQEFDVDQNMSSITSNLNYPFSAEYWIFTLLKWVQRRRSNYFAVRALDSEDKNKFMTIADNVRNLFLETINPFPSERTQDLLCNNKIRISKAMRANCTDGRRDYIASSTFHIGKSPILLYDFLAMHNMSFQWSCVNGHQFQLMLFKLFPKDGDNCVTLHKNVDSTEEAMEDREFFLQEASINQYCSFVVSSPLVGSDADKYFFSPHCEMRDYLQPSGFALMPAEPGGLYSPTSLLTACMRQELDIEDDQAVEIMSRHMNSVIGWMSYCLNLDVRQL